MAASSRLAVELGMWDAECDRRQSALIEKAGLPAKLPAGVDVEEILHTLQLDKKVQDGKVRFVLPELCRYHPRDLLPLPTQPD